MTKAEALKIVVELAHEAIANRAETTIFETEAYEKERKRHLAAVELIETEIEE